MKKDRRATPLGSSSWLVQWTVGTAYNPLSETPSGDSMTAKRPTISKRKRPSE
jgi:hypothetical protein